MKADKDKIKRLLKTARGQLDGLIKMVEEDRYCIDISNQLLSTEAILRTTNREILRAHMHCCVQDAFGSENAEQKIDEVLSLIEKMTK